MKRLWDIVIEKCRDGVDSCREALEEFVKSMCPDPRECEHVSVRMKNSKRYSWIEKIIENGVPDGRSRLILYVVSRYLVNIKELDEEESFNIIKIFLENSCKKYGQCKKIYDSWIRNVLRHVKRGGWKPWSIERIQKEDPELYRVIENIIK